MEIFNEVKRLSKKPVLHKVEMIKVYGGAGVSMLNSSKFAQLPNLKGIKYLYLQQNDKPLVNILNLFRLFNFLVITLFFILSVSYKFEDDFFNYPLYFGCFLNYFLAMFSYFLIKKTGETSVYLDRNKQQVWVFSGKKKKYIAYSYQDFSCHIEKGYRNHGVITYSVRLIIKDKNILLSFGGDDAISVGNLFTEWELIQRIMDRLHPLPDVPDLEAYREFDPVTCEYDKKNNRPKAFWRKMKKQKLKKVVSEFEELSRSYKFDQHLQPKDNEANGWQRPEWLEKPWLHFSKEDLMTKAEAQTEYENEIHVPWYSVIISPDIMLLTRNITPNYLNYYDDENESDITVSSDNKVVPIKDN
ncbi:hypothetical protein [Pseudoalteromonas denitrificans]|uniref:Uncharacterized protein n=1 Tax=Pseudoalteromonas denitrificans DSM 6059 TaxID=1123010 RepID=A0A1I1NFB1_9GAMM|nr:hypothetical protein [Pseudoalteromonas denitrificans]SFC96076.1 hypothetical protein SAMN02745724_03048 [Pseudoalteromonas denitrificans DSM 6059]